MNEAIWIISPNWIAWTLLSIAVLSLAAIAIRLWTQHQTEQTSTHNRREIIAWIAFVMALISIICIFFKSPEPTDASILIAALGVMVTLLVGWQIYKSIEYDKLVRRMDDMEYIAEGYMQFAVGMTRLSDRPDDTLLHCVIALENLNAATHAKYETIFDVLDVLSESPYNSFTKSDKRRLLSALRKTNEPYAEELTNKFKNWPTTD